MNKIFSDNYAIMKTFLSHVLGREPSEKEIVYLWNRAVIGVFTNSPLSPSNTSLSPSWTSVEISTPYNYSRPYIIDFLIKSLGRNPFEHEVFCIWRDGIAPLLRLQEEDDDVD